MHSVWKFLLDDDFLHTYKYGIMVQGPDQIERRVYPWITTYSADYPEKLVIYFCFQLVPLLTTFVGYCWPLSVIRAFAHAHVAWYQSRSSINSEVSQIQGSGFARHASMMENPFARPGD